LENKDAGKVGSEHLGAFQGTAIPGLVNAVEAEVPGLVDDAGRLNGLYVHVFVHGVVDGGPCYYLFHCELIQVECQNQVF
jgi:hypothetical protein